MRITSLRIDNYRTLEGLDISFSPTYAAICGANDSGKTNVVRAIRTLAREGSPGPVVVFPDDDELSLKDDYPKWKDVERQKREVSLALCLSFDKTRDVGFYEFVTKQLSVDNPPDTLDLTVECKYRVDKPGPAVRINLLGKT